MSEAQPPTCPRTFNIAAYLPRVACAAPGRAAVVVAGVPRRRRPTTYTTLTFAQLESLSNRYANGLTSAGITRGMRTLVMLRPGIEFVGVVFALFKIGAVPVMIDPGMGVGRMLECIRTVDLHAFIGIPLAHVMRIVRPSPFRTVKLVVTVGRRWAWGGPTLDDLGRGADDRFAPAPTLCDETAAILFTSGSTGPAKGVVYEHGMFDAQVQAIQSHYGIRTGEVDLPTFPLFALFSAAMGMTAVIPRMDPSHPARVDPVNIVGPIRDHQISSTFGSPALWARVAGYCVDRGITLPSLRRILIAGAPVPHRLIQMLHRVISPQADVHTPYGATESLPVASISGREIIDDCAARTRSGAGICVGNPLPGIELRIIRITDEPLITWSESLVVPDGEVGEIVVSGPVVTKEYFGLAEATMLAKISDGDRIWHRMGDVGYRDARGRIWFCGRKAHRVVTASGTMYSICCEAVFNEHPTVSRSALIGVGPAGRQTPVVVVELQPGRLPSSPQQRVGDDLLQLARSNDLTRSIQTILFHPRFPVDVRHNAKINREALAAWAERRVE